MKRLVTAAGLGAVVLLASTAHAQTGMARGKVLDENGKPVVGAKITWDYQGGMTRKGTVTTNKKGEYIQVGLQPGTYRFTVNVEGYMSGYSDVKVGLGDPTDIPDFKLVPKTGGGAASGPGAGAAGGAAGPADPALIALKAAVDQAMALAAGGKYDEAIAIYADLQAKNPAVYQIAYNLGLLYNQKKDLANAEAMYRKALEAKPDYTEAIIALSNLQLNTGKQAEAADLITKAVAANPNDGRLQLQQGVIYFNSGKQAEAVEVFEKIAAADPTSAEPHYYLGTILIGQNKTAEAAAQLEKYLSLNPQGPNVATAKSLLGYLTKK